MCGGCLLLKGRGEMKEEGRGKAREKGAGEVQSQAFLSKLACCAVKPVFLFPLRSPPSLLEHKEAGMQGWGGNRSRWG